MRNSATPPIHRINRSSLWIRAHVPVSDSIAARLELVTVEAPAGAGSPAAALAMVFKLVESARTRRCANTGAHLVPLVRAGARFENGQLVERTETLAA